MLFVCWENGGKCIKFHRCRYVKALLIPCLGANCCKIQLPPMMKQTVFAHCMTIRDYIKHYCLPSEAFNLFMLWLNVWFFFFEFGKLIFWSYGSCDDLLCIVQMILCDYQIASLSLLSDDPSLFLCSFSNPNFD